MELSSARKWDFEKISCDLFAGRGANNCVQESCFKNVDKEKEGRPNELQIPSSYNPVELHFPPVDARRKIP